MLGADAQAHSFNVNLNPLHESRGAKGAKEEGILHAP